jgi:hypothetical protein
MSQLYQELSERVDHWRKKNIRQADLEQGEAALSPEGRKAVALKKWQDLNPDKFKDQIVYSRTDAVDYEQVQKAAEFLKGNSDD